MSKQVLCTQQEFDCLAMYKQEFPAYAEGTILIGSSKYHHWAIQSVFLFVF